MPTSARRQLIASSRSIASEDRLDLVIHAASQLPSDVTVWIHGDGPMRSQLETLAVAYGIEEQVRFEPSFVAGVPAGTCIYPSRHNARTAPIRPGNAPGGSLIVDDENGEDAFENPGFLDRPAEAAQGTTMIRTMAELLSELSLPADAPAPMRADAAALKGHRVAIVTNYPTHYRVPLFNLLNDRLSEVGVPLHLFFTDAAPTARKSPSARRWMRPEPPRFEHGFFKAVPVPGAATDLPLGLRRSLRGFRPTLLVAAGFSPLASARVARWASRRGVGFGIWSGETPTTSAYRSGVRRRQRLRIVDRASFAIAYGYLGGEYLRELNPALPFVYGRNTTPFPLHSARAPSPVVEVLSVSRAVPHKGLDVLVDAFSQLDDLPCRLTVAGDGPALADLKLKVVDHRRVRLLGAVPSDRIGDLFRCSDVFAFPTRMDPFGLVMVEAFAAGLAVAVSAEPGVVGDLGVDGRTCLIVENHTASDWASVLRRLVEDETLRRTLGDAARHTVTARWTMKHAADAMIAALSLGSMQAQSEGHAT
jgi:glycosyltransferase involved in cell wall biosynthesis